MTPREKAQEIIQKVVDEFGDEVFIQNSYAPGALLEDLITSALTPEFVYRSHVDDEDIEEALVSLERAIAVKDTPEEWMKFTGQTLLFVGKLALSVYGMGPAISIVEKIFGADHEMVTLVKLLGEKLDENNE